MVSDVGLLSLLDRMEGESALRGELLDACGG
jgi:hypothetical protein